MKSTGFQVQCLANLVDTPVTGYCSVDAQQFALLFQVDGTIFTIQHAIGMSQNGEVKPEEYEDRKRDYEKLKRHWVEEMNEKLRAAEISEEIDWTVYWPFRYPDFGF